MCPGQFNFKSKEMLQTTCQVNLKTYYFESEFSLHQNIKKTATEKCARLFPPTVSSEKEQILKDVPWTVQLKVSKSKNKEMFQMTCQVNLKTDHF